MIGAVKPAAPKPIKILPAGIFHGPEKIRRCRPLKGPAAGVLFEGIIELLSAEHTLTQNIERERGFGVGVVAGALQGIGAGHDRHFVFLFEIIHQPTNALGHHARGIILLPFLFGEELHERIEALIHPHPLTLIGIDDHRKPVVAHLVNDDADEPILRALGIGAVLFRTRPLPADHRVLHAADRGIHRDRHRIRIVKCVPRKNFHRVRHRMRAIPAPERFTFLRPIAHAHDLFPVEIHAHGVP